MKKFFYMAVAAIAALSSCSSDDAILNEGGQNENGVTTFTATIEGDDATRATYNTTTQKAEWEANTDQINIGGAVYTALSTGATTTFTGTDAAKDTDNKYHAYFPTSLYNGGTPTLPATQTYTEGKFNMPMYAESATTSLEFKNLCAVLAVTVTSGDIATLKSIKVKADKKLNGSFTVSDNKAVIGDNGTNEVVLTSEDVLDLTTEGTTFYIAIPAQAYQYLNIYLSADGSTYKEAMATKKKEGLGDIARNSMYNINYEKNAVQLWASGPYFATMNIGATSVTDVGGYYTWGGTFANGEDITWTNDHNTSNTGDGNLSSTEDTATKLWGSNWRMPTDIQLKDLANRNNHDYCVWAWQSTGVGGYTFTGKDNYDSNSVFLPAAGYYINGTVNLPGSRGAYWSSTPSGSDRAYLLGILSSTSANVLASDRGHGCPVRAVLAEE